MDLESFRATLDGSQPPADLDRPLQALWWEAQGEWDTAHRLAQSEGGADGAWVHAYLHRREGDEGNARYWYSRAGRSLPALSLDQEWAAIARTLLEARG